MEYLQNYWYLDFSITDQQNDMTISTIGDRGNRDIVSVHFNGSIDYYDSLNRIMVNEFKEAFSLADSVITIGDIEGNGIIEMVVKDDDEYLLIGKLTKSTQLLCTLQSDIPVVHENVSARFVKVDTSDSLYAILVDHLNLYLLLHLPRYLTLISVVKYHYSVVPIFHRRVLLNLLKDFHQVV